MVKLSLSWYYIMVGVIKLNKEEKRDQLLYMIQHYSFHLQILSTRLFRFNNSEDDNISKDIQGVLDGISNVHNNMSNTLNWFESDLELGGENVG